MKIRALSCIVLLMLTASVAVAQHVIPGPSLLCSPPPRVPFTNWAQGRFDPCRSGYNPYEFILGPSNVGNLVTAWEFNTGSINASSPVVVNGILYVGTESNQVFALNAGTGELIWSYQTTGYNLLSPAVVNGVEYVGAGDNLYALNAATGTLLWMYTTGGPIYSSPAVVDGTVYVASSESDHFVYAVNAATGVLVWKAPIGQFALDLAVANGIVYVASNSLYAFNAATGALIWRNDGGSSSYFRGLSVVNGIVYTSILNFMDAFNAATGAPIWTYQLGVYDETLGSPAVATGRVYFDSYRDNLYALDALTGSFLWKNPLTGISPTVANGVVYDVDGSYLYAFDAATGAPLAQYDVSIFAIGSSPVVVNGTVFVCTTGDEYDPTTVFAFRVPN